MMTASDIGILFDLDGTILDTAPDLGNALNHVLALHGKAQCPHQDSRAMASHGAAKMLEIGFGEDIYQYDIETLTAEFLAYYRDNIKLETRYFDGMLACLQSLNTCGIAWGIVTNKPTALTTALLSFFPVLKHCPVVICGDTLAVAKPHPEPLLLAANRLQRQPSEIWYVGDAERDMQAAKAAKMTAVLAAYGYIDSSDDTDNWQADTTVSSPLELQRRVLAHIGGEFGSMASGDSGD